MTTAQELGAQFTEENENYPIICITSVFLTRSS